MSTESQSPESSSQETYQLLWNQSLDQNSVKYGITHTSIHGSQKAFQPKLLVFTALEKAHFKILHWHFIFRSANVKTLIKLFHHSHYMFTDTYAKIRSQKLASLSAIRNKRLKFGTLLYEVSSMIKISNRNLECMN